MKKLVYPALIIMISIIFTACSTSEVSSTVDSVKQNAQKVTETVENVKQNTQKVTDEAKKINEMLNSIKNDATFKKYKDQIIKVVSSTFKNTPGFRRITTNNIKFAKVKDRLGVPCFGASVDITVKYFLNNKEQSKTQTVIVAYDFVSGTWRMLDGGSLAQ
jgi:uncharacterized protein YpuA (DUF1002 family)